MLAERARRLKNLTRGITPNRTLPLLAELGFSADLFYLLQFFTRLYILSSFNATFPEYPRWKLSDLDDDRLDLVVDKIAELPNRTPNGMLLPKRENAIEFHFIQRTIGQILKSLDIDARINVIQQPVHVRFNNGKYDEELGQRAYSSTKVHTDIWNGEPSGVVIVFVPVLGEAAANGIEFFEPDVSSIQDFVRTLDDYSEAGNLVHMAKHYDLEMRKQSIYFADSFLLHRTLKSGKGLRVSIDFRIIPAEHVPSDDLQTSHVSKNWERNFVRVSEFYQVGTTKMLLPRDTFQDAISKFKSGRPVEPGPISHKDSFEIIHLK